MEEQITHFSSEKLSTIFHVLVKLIFSSRFQKLLKMYHGGTTGYIQYFKIVLFCPFIFSILSSGMQRYVVTLLFSFLWKLFDENCDQQTFLTLHLNIQIYFCLRSIMPKKNSNGCSGLFKCKFCSYTTPRRAFMQDHNRIHTGERPYK